MKKIILLFVSLVTVIALSACSDVCVGPECVTGEEGGGGSIDTALPYKHIDGYALETDQTAFILYEYEVTGYVRYQVAYISCTCRPAVNNYWNVAFIEINKNNNDVRYISFDEDEVGGHYTAGLWGDSDPVDQRPDLTFEKYKTDFFPWLIGKTPEDLSGISVFTNGDYLGKSYNTTTIAEQNLIDDFAGGSVSTNNLIRVVKVLMDYHVENYS